MRDVRGASEPLDHGQLREVLGPAGLELVLALGGLLAQVAVAGVVKVAQVVAARIDAVVVERPGQLARVASWHLTRD